MSSDLNRIEALFAAALEQPVDLRDTFLADECGDDRELLDEVRSLLAAHDEGDGDLTAVVQGAAARTVEETEAELPMQRVIGQWRLVERIGVGGMGTVYRAEREDPELRQQAALKLLHRHLVTPEIAERFVAERQILADLDHSNIARLLDGGTTDDDLPWLAMEYIDGETLDAHCQRKRLGLRERIELFIELCGAVQFAHQNLVIHRDIKPSNVLVGGDGVPKLLDFGIAKLMGERADRDRNLTQVGSRLMTPEHASPEQVRGEPVTTATDVYALGILLYQLLTGQRPYAVDDDSAAALMVAICETQPVRPSLAVTRTGLAAGTLPTGDDSEESGRRLARRLEGDLDNILLMALRKEPERRYASPAQFAEDIRRYLEKRPVIARPDTWSYRANRFLRRNAVAVTATAAATTLVIALVAFYTIELAEERDRALEAERAAVREAETTKQTADFMVGLFRISDPDEARGRTITAREILDRGVEAIRTDLSDQPEVQARLMNTMGLVYRSIGLYDSARALLEDAYETRRRALGDDNNETIRSLHNLGRMMITLGDYEAATEIHRRGLEARAALLGTDHIDYADSAANLGQALAFTGPLEESEHWKRIAWEIRLAQLGEEHRQTLVAAGNLAYTLEDLGRYDEAEAIYRKSLAIERRTQGNDSRAVAISLNNLAYMLRTLSRYREAEPLARESLTIREKIYEPGHHSIVIGQSNLASLLFELHRLDEAAVLLDAALVAARERLGDSHIDYAKTLVKRAMVTNAAGEHTAAETLYRQALPVYETSLGPEHNDTAGVRALLAAAIAAQGRGDEAEDLMRDALAAQDQMLGASHFKTLQTRVRLGRLLGKLNNLEEAEALLQTAHAALAEQRGDDDLRTARAAHELAVVLLAQGKVNAASTFVDAAYRARSAGLDADHPDRLATEALRAWAR